MKELVKQYKLIKEGKGNKNYFLLQARQLFPDLVTNYNSYDDTVRILKGKRILCEKKEVKTAPVDYDFTTEFKKNLEKLDKGVTDVQAKMFDMKNLDNVENLNGNSLVTGFIAEMYEKENKEKSVGEIIEIVAKNLKKDPLFYVKNGQFGQKGVGYKQYPEKSGKEAEVKGKYKSSGMEEVKLTEGKSAKSVRDKGGPPKWGKDGFPIKPKYLLNPGDEIEIEGAEDQGLEDGKYLVNQSYWDNDEWNYDLTKIKNDKGDEFEEDVHSFTADYIHGLGYWKGHGVLKNIIFKKQKLKEENLEFDFNENETKHIIEKLKKLPETKIKNNTLTYSYGANYLTLVLNPEGNLSKVYFDDDRSHDFLKHMEELGFGPNIYKTLIKLGKSSKNEEYTTVVSFNEGKEPRKLSLVALLNEDHMAGGYGLESHK